MQRVQYARHGGPHFLTIGDTGIPSPGRGEVLVRVRAAAANAMDWKIRRGELPMMAGRKFPRGVGHDFAGIIENIGDEVLGAVRLPGAFAEYVVANARFVAHKPAALTFADAATLPVAGTTAYQAVTRVGKLQSGQDIFINGCLGGVGRIAVQVATGVGASVAGSCRPGSEHDAHQLGVTTVVDFDFDPAPLTGRFDVIFDTAGLLPPATARQMVKPGGRIIDIVPSFSKLVRTILPGPYTGFMGRPNSADLQHLADAVGRGDITTHILRTVRLADAIPALAALETTATSGGGKLVITVD
jgi:NADPH:quinone reductase-like Zn-dependent oxidoreductase